MKKAAKFMGTLAVVFILWAGNSIDASAARAITLENFDYISYAKAYPDLQALGNDKQALYNHYINCGINEGRIARAIIVKPSKLTVFDGGDDESYYFDAAGYAAQNPDLLAAFGNNKKALWNHYKTNGILEGRAVSGTTDEAAAKLKVFDVAATIANDSMSDREKIKAAHDWIVNHAAYDYQNYLNGTIPMSSYRMEGIMLKGVGVCDAYARTFGYFMYVMGIDEDYIGGVANNGQVTQGHAWNRVMVDDKWLYVDCTWDDPVYTDGVNRPNYDYFLISYEQMARDHTQEEVRHLYY